MKKKWAIKQGMVFKGVYPRLMQGLCLGLGGERRGGGEEECKHKRSSERRRNRSEREEGCGEKFIEKEKYKQKRRSLGARVCGTKQR